jgi:hypothetical protein
VTQQSRNIPFQGESACTANPDGSVARYTAVDFADWLSEALDYASGLYDATGVRTQLHVVKDASERAKFKIVSARQHNGHWCETFVGVTTDAAIQTRGYALRSAIASTVNSVHTHIKRLEVKCETVGQAEAPQASVAS